jgi:hypothetical protein
MQLQTVKTEMKPNLSYKPGNNRARKLPIFYPTQRPRIFFKPRETSTKRKLILRPPLILTRTRICIILLRLTTK